LYISFTKIWIVFPRSMYVSFLVCYVLIALACNKIQYVKLSSPQLSRPVYWIATLRIHTTVTHRNESYWNLRYLLITKLSHYLYRALEGYSRFYRSRWAFADYILPSTIYIYIVSEVVECTSATIASQLQLSYFYYFICNF